MKFYAHHSECPLSLFINAKATEDEYAFLDLGYPGDHADELNGPRIGVRRLQGGQVGWRILIHADGGDPFIAFDITDATTEEAPQITEDRDA